MIINAAPGEVQGTAGLEKKIDNGSLKMVFNVLQNTMYSYPIESTVRETVSNAIDAVKEKEIALSIITGKNKVEDHYINREGEEYESSKFDPTYYDPNWLSTDNKVNLIYQEKDGVGYCDSFIVIDHGVGLSPERLTKMVSLGYSSKRNTLSTIGGFGLGAKSPLSTDVDYFTIESCWNGKKVIVNCYRYKTDFVIGKFNLTNGKLNPMTSTSEGDIYYEESNEKNYTKITIPVKKTNRYKFKEAVNLQLMYFKQIVFEIISESGVSHVQDINPKILYNSKNIIISENNYYSKPHIIIVKSDNDGEGVNYGYIDFKELELQDMYGAIGVKCKIRAVNNVDGVEHVIQEGVDVTPSRERVKFNEATKSYILEKFKLVTKEATALLQREVNEKDFILWLKKLHLITSSNSFDNSSVLGNMSKIVDLRTIAPVFGDSGVRFRATPDDMLYKFGFKMRNFKFKHDKSVQRDEIEDWGKVDWNNIYYKLENTSVEKDKYLITNSNNKQITVIELGEIDSTENSIVEKLKKDSSYKGWKQKELEDLASKRMKSLKTRREALITFLNDSIANQTLSSYDSIEVPENWEESIENESEKKAIKEGGLTREEIRKLHGQIVMTVPEVKANPSTIFSHYNNSSNDPFCDYTRIELPLKDFVENDDLYFGTEEDRNALHLATAILYPHNRENLNGSGIYRMFYPSSNIDGEVDNQGRIVLAKISQTIANKYSKRNKKHKHISKLFWELNDNFELVSPQVMKDWYTSNYIYPLISGFKFLDNYKQINPAIYSIYTEVMDYINRNSANGTAVIARSPYKEEAEKVIPYLNKIRDFQLYLQDNPSPEDIVNKSKELFNDKNIAGGSILNMEMYHKALIIQDYCEPLKGLLNYVDLLSANTPLPTELVAEVNKYLQLKDRLDFKIPGQNTDSEVIEAIILEEQE